MPELTEEMKEARESWAKRWEEYKPAREEQFRIKENKARRESKLNTEFAKKLREEYKSPFLFVNNYPFTAPAVIPSTIFFWNNP